jgi:hypothetical protein
LHSLLFFLLSLFFLVLVLANANMQRS